MAENTTLLADIPESIEIIDHRRNKCIRHADFLRLIEGKVNELTSAGLKRKDRIVLGISDPLEFLVSLFGGWEIGACVVVVNPDLTVDEQKRVIGAINPVLWLGEVPPDFEPPPRLESTDADNTILVLMTSGTTGNPKGVMLSQEALTWRLQQNIHHIGKNCLAHSLCVLPLFFGHGLIGNCLTVLAAGGKLTLWPVPTLHEMVGLSEVIEQRRIRFLSSVPSFWKLVLTLSRPPNPSLQRVHVGSAPLSTALGQDIANWAGTHDVFNTYGMSETANWIAGGSLQDAGQKDGYVGKPWGGTFGILSDGQVTASGRGEVLVHNNALMEGYLGQPELSKTALEGGWLHTGDIGELNARGELVLVGRIKSEINVGGIKVLSEEVELMLERHSSILEACAFPVSDAIAGERVGVAIACKKEAQLDKETVVNWCLMQARKEVAPKEVYFLDMIPKNDRGKIVRTDVAKVCLGPDHEHI